MLDKKLLFDYNGDDGDGDDGESILTGWRVTTGRNGLLPVVLLYIFLH